MDEKLKLIIIHTLIDHRVCKQLDLQNKLKISKKRLQEVVEQLNAELITDGCEVMGYCPWSAIDLISTHEGIKKRYGFIYVDRDEFDIKTLKRYRKDSFYWYKKVIESNGMNLL